MLYFVQYVDKKLVLYVNSFIRTVFEFKNTMKYL